jgi:hypothetical protein
MGRSRQGSVASRVTISVIALYALLLQAIFASAGPVAAFDPSAGVACSEDGSQSGGPSGEHHHHAGLCCILACAACGCAYIATASTIAVFPARAGVSFNWDQAPAIAARPPLKFFFGARGPPQDI